MDCILLLPVLLPILLAIPCYFISRTNEKLREPLFIFVCLINFALNILIAILSINGNSLEFSISSVLGLGLSFSSDSFRILYSLISEFLWLATIIFSKEYMKHYPNKERYYFFCLITLSGVLGVFYSADLFTCFCFFEIMSFASYPMVIHEENEDAMDAGATYLTVAVISGMMLLVGVFFIYLQTGSVNYNELRSFFSNNSINNLTFAGGILVLLGFGAKAGMYPLHIWLPKAHPVAPAPASALLSGILTKTGVFGIIVLCADIFTNNKTFGLLLLAFAVITMFLGALLALFSINIKRTLACSSMSQIGFILVGVSFSLLLGKEGGLAQCGALLHMANHSFIKLVLFMCAGVIAMNIHQLDLNKIRGFGRKKPFLMIIFLIGALGIMGVPLFNGYISKTMIHESIVEYISINGLVGFENIVFKAIEWIFLISGGLTVAYMTKIFVCVFVEKNTDNETQKKYDDMKKYLSPLSRAVFVISSLPLLVIGLLPNFVTENIIAPAHEFFGVEKLEHLPEFFGFESLKGGAISIAIGVVIYFAFVKTVLIKNNEYKNQWNEKIDLEKLLYRPIVFDLTKLFIKTVVSFISNIVEWLLTEGVLWFIYIVCRFIAQLLDLIILLLNKTVLKPYVYKFCEDTFVSKVGRLIQKIYPNKKGIGKRFETISQSVSQEIKTEYDSFSFAFAMISIGILIVLIFAIFY